MDEKQFKLIIYLLKQIIVTLELVDVSIHAAHQIDAETLVRTRQSAYERLDEIVKEFLE